MSRVPRSVTVLLICLVMVGSALAQLLVSDRATNQVAKYDATTGGFLGVLVGGNPEINGGLLAPSAMTIGANGELLVASQFTGSVLRYDFETGEFLGEFATQINGPSGLLYDAAKDELFVSTLGNFDSELVLRYRASTGELLSAIGGGTGASGRTSLTFGPDGELYVGSFANGEFFTGAVLRFDAETFEPDDNVFALNPFLAGANGLVFRDGASQETYQLDVVGLFSNNVARFDVATTENGLSVQSTDLLITEELDFPSAIQDLGDGTMLVTNLGNDNPATGELRPGSIGRFDVNTGEFLGTFITPGGEGNLSQPTSLLLIGTPVDLDCNGDGVVNAEDLACACSTGIRDEILADLNLLAGDFDADGTVEFDDFLVLSASFNQAADYVTGDIDCSGIVDFADFLVLSTNFNQSSNVSAVPEPSCAHLLIGSVVLLGVLRKRRFPARIGLP